MKKIATTLFLCTLLSSCNKESAEGDYITITGFVRDFQDDSPIQGAKIYSKKLTLPGGPPGGPSLIVDSALSDAYGKASFRYRKSVGEYRFLIPEKSGYLNAISSFGINGYNQKDRKDSLFLSQPSYLNLTVHNSATYLPSDIVEIKIKGDYGISAPDIYRTLFRDSVNRPDKFFYLQAVYSRPAGYTQFGTTHIYFIIEISRNNNPIATRQDSAELIKFGTKNFTLNY